MRKNPDSRDPVSEKAPFAITPVPFPDRVPHCLSHKVVTKSYHCLQHLPSANSRKLNPRVIHASRGYLLYMSEIPGLLQGKRAASLLELWERAWTSQGRRWGPRAVQDDVRTKKPPKDRVLGRIFLRDQRPRDVPDRNFMNGAFFCFSRHGMAGMSRDLGWELDTHEGLLEKF